MSAPVGTGPRAGSHPSETAEPPRWLEQLTPRQIVAELDRYVVGQNAAKKAVAIALRNQIGRAHV